MKLEKFKQRDPKKIGITIFTVVCVLLVTGVFFYTSFASFQVQEDFNIIEGTVGNNGDLYFAFYVDDVISKTMPQKGEGYKINKEKTTCTKGASVEFNETDWSVKVLNMTERNTKCTLYFEKTGAGYIEDLYENGDSSLAYDETVDNNLRYIGANPNNYVSFNNELWRIIGVFNNIDDGTGNKETRIKIMRSESIGSYSWDNKPNAVGSSTSVYGSNDWSDSTLQQVLNSGAYWNRTSGECPSGENGATVSCDFSEIGLTDEAKSMMGSVLWNVGGHPDGSPYTASRFYISERDKVVYNGRPTTWNGKVGLMYPSDYGYATSGGSMGQNTCLNYSLGEWNNYNDCFNNNWLYTNQNKWTLTSQFDIGSGAVYINGQMTNTNYVNARYDIYPSAYLISTIEIIAGTGLFNDPYILLVD